MTSLAGITVDEKFEVLSQIGSGGMGSVYRAIQHPFEREVALKVLSTLLPDDPEAPARFEREALAISALKHKNIVMFYGYGVWHKAPYMVMEYVKGRSLQSYLSATRPLDQSFALRLIEQVADALAHAHANGIVHRDLKPSNIMIVGDENEFTVKLIDFGLAAVLPSFGKNVQKLTEAGMAVGTVLYMSPEQCIGDQADARSDIYSLGCIMYHCLTGVAPFGGDHSVVVMQKHLNDPIPRLPRNVPPELQTILDHATEKNREMRYRNTDEMLADLRSFLHEGTLFNTYVKTPVAPPAVAGRNPLPKKAIVIAVAGLSITMMVGALLLFKSQRPPKVASFVDDRKWSAERTAMDGCDAYMHGDADQAIVLLRRAIAEDDARPQLNRTLRLQSSLSLAQSLVSRGRREEARQAIKTTLDRYPGAVQEALPLARLLVDVYLASCRADERFDDGEAFVENIVRIAKKGECPDWPTWVPVMALAMNEAGHADKGIVMLQHYLPQITVPAQRYDAIHTLSTLQFATHNLPEATKTVQEGIKYALDQKLDDNESLLHLGEDYIAIWQWQKALDALKRVEDRHFHTPAVCVWKAHCEVFLKDYDAARRDINKAVTVVKKAHGQDRLNYKLTIINHLGIIANAAKKEGFEKESQEFRAIAEELQTSIKDRLKQ